MHDLRPCRNAFRQLTGTGFDPRVRHRAAARPWEQREGGAWRLGGCTKRIRVRRHRAPDGRPPGTG